MYVVAPEPLREIFHPPTAWTLAGFHRPGESSCLLMASPSRRLWVSIPGVAAFGAAARVLSLRREGGRGDVSPPAGAPAQPVAADSTRAGAPAGAPARWDIQRLPPEWDPPTATRLAAAIAARPE